MQTWLSIEEFSKLIGKDVEEIKKLCQNNELSHKIENDTIYIEANAGTKSLIPVAHTEIIESPKGDTILEKTISTLLNLHERVLEAKDETISTLQGENEFLKSSVISMQEIYDEDRKTIESLQKQLQLLQEELEFCRRKYKLMWKKALQKEEEDE